MSEAPWELPPSWAWSTLDEVASWSSGGTPKSTESRYYGGDIPWLIIGDLNDNLVTSSAKSITARGLENSSAKFVEPGAVMIALYGTSENFGIAGMRCTTNQAIAFTQAISDAVLQRFLFYYLKAARGRLLDMGKGGAQQNISQTVLKAFPICVAPIAEQQRIVAKLDKLLGQVGGCQQRLARVPVLLKRFRQSVLAAACSGRLTADWREDNSSLESGTTLLARIKETRLKAAESTKEKNRIAEAFQHEGLTLGDEELSFDGIPESWFACRIGAIGMVVNGSTPSRKEEKFWGGDIPWVSSGEVRNNIISATREGITKTGYESCSVRLLPCGTVLLAMIGEGKTRGQSSILQIEATINQNIAAILIPHGLVRSEFLWRWFQHQYEATRERGSGSGPQALNCQRVRELPFVLPPLAEQKEIVRRVESLFALADRIEARFVEGRKRVDSMPQAILAKAFHGELVPTEAELVKAEGRSFESAEELLKRIKGNGQLKQNPLKRARKIKA